MSSQPGAMESIPSMLAAKSVLARERIRDLQSVVVAFSGGVDSALALRLSVDELGPQRVLAATARSASVPPAEQAAAAALAAQIGVAHRFVDTGEFSDSRYLANPADRCYYCKNELYGRLRRLACDEGLAGLINGVIADDLGDHRPGLRAAAEHGVRAPLAEAGMTKADVRALARLLGLAVHAKPASPCLSSRVPYGESITPEKLRRIDAAETALRELGFAECRVRSHGDLARIEVPASDLARFADASLRQAVDAALTTAGFRFVALDLRGFRSGSLNEGISLPVAASPS